jgi:hypothetical protein
MHPAAASIRMSIRSRWPALRPPDGGFDLIGTYAAIHGITVAEAVEHLARAAGLKPGSAAVTEQHLRDAFCRLRKSSTLLRDGAARFEGLPWRYADGIASRHHEGWELRVYQVDDGIEVCLIDPQGKSKTYA